MLKDEAELAGGETMHVESPDQLSAWLVKELAPICDAEPGALAKYVLALLRKPDKNEQELHDFCAAQLEVFLQNRTKPFVEKLFTVIRDNSYIAKPASPPPSTTSSISTITTTSAPSKEDVVTKRVGKENGDSQQNESESRRKPPLSGANAEKVGSSSSRSRESENRHESSSGSRLQRKRISPPPPPQRSSEPRRRSRSPRRRPLAPSSTGAPPRRGSVERRKRSRSRSRSRSPRSRSRSPYERRERVDRKEKREEKKRCRDYDEKGYCMRGDQCPFDHGPDPVVVDDISMEKMVNIAPPPKHFNIPPPGYTPINPPPPGVDYVPGPSTVEALSTAAPPPMNFSVPPPPIMSQWRPPFGIAQQGPPIIQPVTNYEPPMMPTMPSHGMMPMRGRGGRGRGMGRFNPHVGGNASLPSTHPAVVQRTLQVRKIPIELNTITKLNEHFSKFGNIVNMQLQFDGDPESALITFSNRYEATAAYKSTDPILNNRFIRVFWHQVPEGAQQTPSQSPQQQAPGGQRTFPTREQLTVTRTGGPQRIVTNVSSTESLGSDEGRSEVQKLRPPLPPQHDLPQRPSVLETKRKKKTQLKLMELQKRKQDLLAKFLEKQKAVIAKVKKAETDEDKKAALKLLKSIKKHVDSARAELKDLSDRLVAISEKKKEGSVESKAEEIVEGQVEVVSTLNLLKRTTSEASVDDEAKKPKLETAERFEAGAEKTPEDELLEDGVVPDTKRRPDEQVTPAALLATVADDSDDE